MGSQEKIEKQTKSPAFTHFKNSIHKENLEELWEVVCKYFEEPEDIEIISVAQSYKIIFKEGKIIKGFVGAEYLFNKLKILYNKGIAVSKPIIRIKGKKQFWNFVEWIKGTCRRDVINDKKRLQNIEPHYYTELGKLLGQIHSVVCDGEKRYLGVTDCLWWNYVIHNNTISLIDTKKFWANYMPEQWIFQLILFNEHITLEQKKAFTDGYMITIVGKREGLSLDLLKATKEFMDRLYEKLAK